MSSGEIEKKLLKEINKGGFPLELRAIDVFRRRKWHVTPSAYYVDRDEGKGREIDVSATLLRTFPAPSVGDAVFACTTAVECKASDSPFVVFSSAGDALWPPSFRIISVPGPLTLGASNTADEDGLKPIPHSPKRAAERGAPWYQDLRVRVGHSLVQPHKGGGRDGHAVHQAVKAALHTAKEKRDQQHEQTSGVLQVFLPMVVVDAPLFEAHLQDGEIKLERVEHATVQHNYISPTYDGQETLIPGYMVEVVTIDHLPTFLADVLEPSLRALAFEHFGVRADEPGAETDATNEEE